MYSSSQLKDLSWNAIFFEDPDLSLYPRFINNIFADLIVILFNNSQEKPFQVI